MPFELPPWLQETSKPFQTFAQGATIGLAIGRSYAQARQFQQSMDLQQKQLARADASHSLAYMINATKFIQDQQDYKALEQFTPTVSTAMTFDELSKFKVPMLHDTKNYLSLSALLDRRKTEKAMGEMAGELANTTDWADPAVRGIMLKWAQKAPDITLEPAYEHLTGRHEAAIKARMTAQAPVWVPDDSVTGMPGHMRTATGQVRFPPRLLDDGTTFTPKEMTTPGGTELVQVSPNKWQVVDKPPMSGKLTDPEQNKVQDNRAEIRALANNLGSGELFKPGTPLRQAYDVKLAKIDALKKENDVIYEKATTRSIAPTGAESAADPNERVEVTKDGQTMTLPRSQLEEGRKQGWIPK